MDFEESDKPLIKAINSNQIRAARAEKVIRRVEYLTEAVCDALSFSLILKNRGDFKHSEEYIEIAINVSRIIHNVLARERELVWKREKDGEAKLPFIGGIRVRHSDVI